MSNNPKKHIRIAKQLFVGMSFVSFFIGLWLIQKHYAVSESSLYPGLVEKTATIDDIKVEGTDKVFTLPILKGRLTTSSQYADQLSDRALHAAFLNNHPFHNRKNIADEKEKDTGDDDEYEYEDKDHPDRPDLAFEQDFLRTMNPALKRPTPEVLSDIIRNNAIQRSRVATNGIPGATGNPWVERGPNNVGGRTRTLVWDPNDATGKKVWAGAVTGGLWYNNDIANASSSWTRVDDFWGNITVTALAFDPNNKQIAYAGTGEGWNQIASGSSGAGIWKTTDGGSTWNQISSTANFNFISDIAVRNESGTSVVYAAVNSYSYAGTFLNSPNEGLQRSIDGGVSWTQVLPKIPGNGSYSIIYAPSSIAIGADNTIWVGTKASIYSATDGGGGRVLVSTNGTTWSTSDIVTVSNGTGRVTVACAPSDPNYIYSFVESGGEVAYIRRSVNGGLSWSSLSLPVETDQDISSSDFTRGQAWYDQLLEVDPNNPSTVIIGGVDLFMTTNAGSTWTQISKWSNNNNLNGLTCSNVHADHHCASFKPGSSSTVVFGNDGGVFYTNSLSTAANSPVITDRNTNYNVTQFYAAAMHPTAGSNYYLAGAQDNGTQKFTSAGLAGTTSATGGDGGYCFIDQQNPQIQITNTTNNNVYLSTNGGTSFTKILTDKQTGSFINPGGYDNNLHILYTYKSQNALYRVSNLTGTPLVQTISITGLISDATTFKVSPYTTTSTTLFVGAADGSVLKVTNADGASPGSTDISSNLPAGSVSCIEIGASENELLVTFFNYGISKIWYTSNGGASWVNKSLSFPNIPVRNALFNPNNRVNEVILATELGMYGTTNFSNSSPTWTQINNGFANVRTDMLQIRSSDKQVVAATHGRGLFSNNAFSSNLPAPAISSFTPTSASAGNTVTITGTDLNGAIEVSFGGTPATAFTVVNATTILATIGNGSSGNVLVSTQGGTVVKSGFTFTVGPPVISSFTPVSGGTGTAITLTGSNFTGTSLVYFGGITATSYNVISNTTLVAVVGTGASGSISVTTATGSTAKTGFTYVKTPAITSFTPTSAAAGNTVTITGTNLTGATGVNFGGTAAASFSVITSTTISAVPGLGSTGDITVTTAGGTAALSGFTFILGPPPTISSFTPAVGPIGTTVTITGTNFNATASANIVYFGAVKAAVTSASTTSLTVSVPAGATYQPITVLNTSTGQLAYSNKPFLVSFAGKNAITNGDLSPKVDFTTGAGSNGIVIGDIDGDGKADVMIANINDNTVSVYRNTSTSGNINSNSFASKVSFTTGFRPTNMALGDLDGDGKLDLALSSYNGTTVTVLRNTASSGVITSTSFAAKVEFTVGSINGLSSIAIHDFDGDGKPDLAIMNPSRNVISVLRNTAQPGNITSSSFNSYIDYSTGGTPYGIALGDLDGDGKPDISVANLYPSGPATAMAVFRNTAVSGSINTNSFAAKVDLPTAYYNTQHLAVGDLDGDGKQDITIISSQPAPNIYVYRNTATSGVLSNTGSFAARVSFSSSVLPTYTCIGDIDGDGKPEIILSSQGGNTLSIFRNTSVQGTITSSSFAPKVDFITGSQPNIFTLGDIDGDGKTDIIVLNTGSNSFSVFRNNPSIPPTITSIDPTSAGAGSMVTITGTNFTNVSSISFGGTGVGSFSTLSSTTILAKVPAGSGSGNVVVTTPGGTASISGFIFIPAPFVSSFTPTSALPGATLTITGGNFSGTGSVTIGGTAVASFSVLSSTTITAVVGNGSNGNVSVTTPGGTSAKSGFIIPPPTITGFSPSSGGVGAVITITGTNLTGTSLVSFGGITATSFVKQEPFTVTAIVPAGVGTGTTISLTTPGGVATKTGFTFCPAPVITANGGITTVCSGTGAVVLNSNATNAIQWYKDGVLVNGATSASFTPTGSGLYSLTALGTGGCAVVSAGFTVTINEVPPVPSITAGGPLTICAGSGLVLTSSSAAGYKWYKDAIPISGASSAVFTATVSGVYLVVVNNANACTSTSTSTTVTVNAVPSVPSIVAGGPLVFCDTGKVVLTSDATTGNQWYRNNTLITGANGVSYTVTQTGSYTVSVTNSNNCSASSLATTVTVNAIPGKPVITLNTTDLVSSIASGNQWFKDASSISGATAQNYRPTLSGYYKVQATNAGCTGVASDPYYYLTTAVLNINGNFIGTYRLIPNPATERLYIQAGNANDKITVQMIDPNGRVVIKQEFTGSTIIDMATFAKGI